MKRAIVTGGTRGIGLAVSALLSEQGFAVTALYAHDDKAAQQARERIAGLLTVKADVSREEEVAAVFAQMKSVDLLVNNVGVALYKQVQDTLADDWRRVIDVNAGGAFLCTKHAVKKMLEHGGAIVNVSSVWGEAGGSCESVYSASKGALIAFTKAVAKELAPSDITVNCVCPGVIETEMNAHLNAQERAALCNEIPLGRFGTGEEVARAVLFLAENRYVTGQILSVNGGFYM